MFDTANNTIQESMKVVFSFSLFGRDPKYTKGAIYNSILIKDYMPEEWKMRVYYDRTVPVEIIYKLKENGVELVEYSDKIMYGMFYRFLIMDDNTVDVGFIRDADDRFSKIHYTIAKEFIDSQYLFHLGRVHDMHRTAVLGGLWGYKKELMLKYDLHIEKGIIDFHDGKQLGRSYDQFYLTTIYDKVDASDILTHGELFNFKTGGHIELPGNSYLCGVHEFDQVKAKGDFA